MAQAPRYGISHSVPHSLDGVLIHVKTPASSTSIGAASGVKADHQPLGSAGAGWRPAVRGCQLGHLPEGGRLSRTEQPGE
jgi:hypothetical protein